SARLAPSNSPPAPTTPAFVAACMRVNASGNRTRPTAALNITMALITMMIAAMICSVRLSVMLSLLIGDLGPFQQACERHGAQKAEKSYPDSDIEIGRVPGQACRG